MHGRISGSMKSSKNGCNCGMVLPFVIRKDVLAFASVWNGLAICDQERCARLCKCKYRNYTIHINHKQSIVVTELDGSMNVNA